MCWAGWPLGRGGGGKGAAVDGTAAHRAGERIAPDAARLAQAVVDQLTQQTVDCLLEAAFAEDRAFAGEDPAALARHR
jgi:hypothetical protein